MTPTEDRCVFHQLLFQANNQFLVFGSPTSKWNDFGVYSVRNLVVSKNKVSFTWEAVLEGAPPVVRKPGKTREDGDLEYIIPEYDVMKSRLTEYRLSAYLGLSSPPRTPLEVQVALLHTSCKTNEFVRIWPPIKSGTLSL